MIVPAVPHVPVIGAAHGQRAIEPKRYQAFGRQLHPSASRDRLSDSAGARTGGRADGGTFSAARDGADDSTEQGAATYILTGPFVRADTFLFLPLTTQCFG